VYLFRSCCLGSHNEQIIQGGLTKDGRFLPLSPLFENPASLLSVISTTSVTFQHPSLISLPFEQSSGWLAPQRVRDVERAESGKLDAEKNGHHVETVCLPGGTVMAT
jgi:hypothetical protein